MFNCIRSKKVNESENAVYTQLSVCVSPLGQLCYACTGTGMVTTYPSMVLEGSLPMLSSPGPTDREKSTLTMTSTGPLAMTWVRTPPSVSKVNLHVLFNSSSQIFLWTSCLADPPSASSTNTLTVPPLDVSKRSNVRCSSDGLMPGSLHPGSSQREPPHLCLCLLQHCLLSSPQCLKRPSMV